MDNDVATHNNGSVRLLSSSFVLCPSLEPRELMGASICKDGSTHANVNEHQRRDDERNTANTNNMTQQRRRRQVEISGRPSVPPPPVSLPFYPFPISSTLCNRPGGPKLELRAPVQTLPSPFPLPFTSERLHPSIQ
ncbi:hypothetical protein D9613_012361 [Agrocybe pediades]|uniref:Uncharacterized protein n=1 Tax=Agrocybe pediades TaxID=84607 RepID=A0A8H4VPN5_9AGAR|nr:hypothetical protein D9613_012361 [Agrocybe pediades]